MFIPWSRINQNGGYLRLLLIVIFCCLQVLNFWFNHLFFFFPPSLSFVKMCHPEAATWWATDAFGISLVWCGQQGFIYLTLIDIFRSPYAL